jgi:hypothetical protein
VVPTLIGLVNDQLVDAQGLNVGALHALWTLHGLGAIPGDAAAMQAARNALSHPSASLRRAALQVLPRNAQLLDDIFAAGLLPDRSSPHAVDYTVSANVLQDGDPQVRLTALLTLSELPASERTARSILDLIYVPQNARDPWLPDAAAIAGIKQGPDFLNQFLQRRTPTDSAAVTGLRNVAVLMTRHYAAHAQAGPVVNAMVAATKVHPVIGLGVLEAIAPPPAPAGRGGGPGGRGALAWPEDQPPVLTAEQRAALTAAAQDASAEIRSALGRVAVRWGMPDLFGAR